ncbi:transmembrane protein 220 isoform X2 [Melanerpes formicivorus]|uniref:transmembrane protein 220 isoform X2 n=1 Tax=Melanerpes formicivorus TaxID=211600 RepID=UPI00358E8550
MSGGRTSVWLWRLCNLLMAAFFGLAAAVQVVYLVPAALTLLVSMKPSITGNGVWRLLCALHSAGCIVGITALACSLFAYAEGNIVHEEEGSPARPPAALPHLLLAEQQSAAPCIEKNISEGKEGAPLGGAGLAAAVVVALLPLVSWLYISVHSEMRASWPTHCKTVM